MTWHNKHRPTEWGELVGQPTDEIQAWINGKHTPNFILHGPPGTGKTTAAQLIAQAVGHGDGANLHTINASDERGIDAIREKVNTYARLDSRGGSSVQATLGLSLPVVLLDEADRLTAEAQDALRAPMEDSSAVFVLTGNNPEKITGPIKSRAKVYHFGEPTAVDICDRLRQIADAEDMTVDEPTLSQMASQAGGDMRTAIDYLEQEHRIGTEFGNADTDAGAKSNYL